MTDVWDGNEVCLRWETSTKTHLKRGTQILVKVTTKQIIPLSPKVTECTCVCTAEV